MSLRDEFLEKEENRQMSKKPKAVVLQELSEELCRVVELRLKKNFACEIYEEKGWINKTYISTGEKAIAEFFPYAFIIANLIVQFEQMQMKFLFLLI